MLKHLNFYVILPLLIFVCSCKKSTDAPAPLPDEYFMYKFDGEQRSPKAVTTYFDQGFNLHKLVIRAYDVQPGANNPKNGISLFIDSTTERLHPIRIFHYTNEGLGFAGFDEKGNPFQPTGDPNNQFILTKMEYKIGGYVEGTFNCQVEVGNINATVNITEGKFRIKIK